MGFIDTLLNLLSKKIDNERSWLEGLRTATESWYNQLTEPLLPLLMGKINPEDTDAEKKYKTIAEGLLKEAFISNAGNAVNNLFQEMGKRGLPFISSRKMLAPHIQAYMESGIFLKKLVFGFHPKSAREQWQEFRNHKDQLVAEINNQLRRIG